MATLRAFPAIIEAHSCNSEIGSFRESPYVGRKFDSSLVRAGFFPKRGRALEGGCAVEGRPDVINSASVLQINSVRVYWTLAIMYHPASNILCVGNQD